MDAFRQDIRFALRSLRRSPAFALIAVTTLALGVGANTSIFSVVNGVLLRPLAFPHPDQLYTVWEDRQARDGPATEWTGASTFSDWRSMNRTFEGMTASAGWAPNLTGGDRPEGLIGRAVTPGYFPVMGVRPALGRAFLPEEETPGRGDVVVLSHELWQRRFGGDPGVLGSNVTLDARSYTIVGVMPPGFRAPLNPDAQIWTPFSIDPSQPDRGNFFLRVIGRLRPGTDRAVAQADMDRVGRAIAEANPTYYRDVGVTLVPLQTYLVGPARTPMLILLAAVGLVLLIACVNVANLLMARITGRERELAVRAALGAGRARLAWQILTESMVLGLLGGAVGLGLGIWGMDLLRRYAPPGTPRIDGVSLDLSVFAFALLISVGAGIVFGMLPALGVSRRPNVAESLRERSAAGLGSASRVRSGLVIAELALGLTLLVGAGLLIRSLLTLQSVDPGFRARGVLTTRVILPSARYEGGSERLAFWRTVQTRLEADGRIDAAGATNALPMSGTIIDLSFLVEGTSPPPGDEPAAQYRVVTRGYFAALGIPLARGRLFEASDVVGAPQVVLVNRALARRYFPGEDPIGRRIRIGDTNDEEAPWWTIVGLVGDVHDRGLAQAPDPTMYVSFTQRPRRVLYISAHTTGTPEALIPALRDAVRAADPDLPLTQTSTMDRFVRMNLASPRFVTWLLAAFAALALMLAIVGIYGVIAYTVTRGTREIGVRMALGARPRDVLTAVMRRALALTALGLLIGLFATLGVTRFMSSLLYQVRPMDPVTLTAVSALLAATALAAAFLPARRATRIDPMIALRHE